MTAGVFSKRSFIEIRIKFVHAFEARIVKRKIFRVAPHVDILFEYGSDVLMVVDEIHIFFYSRIAFKLVVVGEN